MCKHTIVVLIMMSLAAGFHASVDLEVALQDYLSRYPMGVQTKSEYGLRKSLFRETHARIELRNSNAAATFQMEHNAFSTMTEDEKQARLGGMKPERPVSLRQISNRQLPTSIDYRTDACLSAVRNQGRCGSCWTFSATAVVEFGKYKKAGGTARDLSEQQLVDCSRVNGCSGGWDHEAWQYLSANGGQATELSYNSSAYVEWASTVDTMKTVLASRSILSVYMQLPSSFFNYKSGVFYDTTCVPSNAHAMNVVGYGTLKDLDYWVVRNSWGSGWGAGGYILVRS